ncbi:MAG: PAS domain-containing sensor histidine kinase [Nitrospirae bacterium]|nr:MAG: PAS domain-containing sensor histidine kinase [Nitrospirota bacterium]
MLESNTDNPSSEDYRRLLAENKELKEKYGNTVSYLRKKIDQLLLVMGTLPLKPEELDDSTLIELDPIGIIAGSFDQVLKHLHTTNDNLQIARDEIKAIFDSAGIGILVLDNRMRVVSYNKKQRELFKTDPEAVSGEECYKVMCGADDMPSVCTFRRVMKLKRPVHLRNWKFNGRLYDVAGTPIVDKHGEVARVVLAYMDITDRKRAEEELARVNKFEAAGIFAGGIAHDFNNLLTSILGNISLAKTLVSPKDRIAEKLNSAESASMKAKELTHKLLTVAGVTEPQKKKISVPNLIKDATVLAMSFSSAVCEYKMQDGLWTIDADEAQLRQVIHNIVVNACEAVTGNGTIKIRAENISVTDGDPLSLEAGPYVKITIEDNGSGISEENLPKIFDPYFTTKGMGSRKGRGLGLASAFSIIRSHSGSMAVSSRSGVGTVCSIYLPADAHSGEATDGQTRIAGRAIVMDDEEIVREVAGDMLSLIGLDVSFALNSDELINAYKNAAVSGRPFDIVIMDVNIPEDGGAERAISGLLAFDPAAKAVVSSGNPNDKIMVNFERYGFAGALTKPFKMSEITAIMKRLGVG